MVFWRFIISEVVCFFSLFGCFLEVYNFIFFSSLFIFFSFTFLFLLFSCKLFPVYFFFNFSLSSLLILEVIFNFLIIKEILSNVLFFSFRYFSEGYFQCVFFSHFSSLFWTLFNYITSSIIYISPNLLQNFFQKLFPPVRFSMARGKDLKKRREVIAIVISSSSSRMLQEWGNLK